MKVGNVPSRHTVCFSPKKQRERTCEMLFEQFDVQGYFVALQSLLPMFESVTISLVQSKLTFIFHFRAFALSICYS